MASIDANKGRKRKLTAA